MTDIESGVKEERVGGLPVLMIFQEQIPYSIIEIGMCGVGYSQWAYSDNCY